MLESYRPLFEVPGARRFIIGGLIARSAGAMFAVSVVAMVSARTGSYQLAGAVVAVGMVALALFAPFLGRLVDRYGQRRIAIPFFLWSGFWAVMTVLTSLRGWPSWLLFVTFPLAGAIPNLGTMARARWSHLFAHDPRNLHSAMSFEQVMEELTFVIGPVLAIWLSTSWFPEAGFAFAILAYTVGVLVFISARSTEPPVVPHHERPTSHAHRVPGLLPLAGIMVMTGAIFGVNEVVTLAVSAGARGAGRCGGDPRAVCRGVGRRGPALRSLLARAHPRQAAPRRHARHGRARAAAPLRPQPLGARAAHARRRAWPPRRPSSRR